MKVIATLINLADDTAPATGTKPVIAQYENVKRVTASSNVFMLTYTDGSTKSISRTEYSLMIRS